MVNKMYYGRHDKLIILTLNNTNYPPVGLALPLAYRAMSPTTTTALRPSQADDSIQLIALKRAAVPPKHALVVSMPSMSVLPGIFMGWKLFMLEHQRVLGYEMFSVLSIALVGKLYLTGTKTYTLIYLPI